MGRWANIRPLYISTGIKHFSATRILRRRLLMLLRLDERTVLRDASSFMPHSLLVEKFSL